MKTLRKNGEYVRMSYSTEKQISIVDNMVENDLWIFVPKKEWKEWKQTFEKPKSEEKTKNVKETKSKKKDKKK